MTVLNPKVTKDPIVDSWSLSVAQTINKILEVKAAAAALADLDTETATNRQLAVRMNELKGLLEDL